MADFLPNFNFQVKVLGFSGKNDMAFQEVSGLEKEIKTEEVIGGGDNKFKYKLPAGMSSPNIVLKRGVTLATSPLIVWCISTLDSGFEIPVITKNVQVQLLNKVGQPCMSWDLIDAYPIKWSATSMKSDDSSVFVETIELAYKYFDLI